MSDKYFDLEAYNNYDLWKHTAEYLERPRISYPRGGNMYPSEASVAFTNEWGERQIEGGCLRKSFYRMTGVESEGPQARSERIFSLGKYVEVGLVEMWKKMGIWVGNNIPFVTKEFGLQLKGELDVVLVEPDGKTLYGVEVKSFYGYYAGKEIMGNKSTVGHPKTSQLLQTLIYTYLTRPGGGWTPELDHFKMIYQERGDGTGRQFKVELVPIGDGDFRPAIDGKLVQEFTMNNVKERYLTLKEHVEKGEVPPRDFAKTYTEEKIRNMIVQGRISKTKQTAFEKRGDRFGDWQCSYCPYAEQCYNKANI